MENHGEDYYPFGMLMSGRQFSSPAYRYGFNGKEKTDEWNGNTGANYDYGARIYDSRLGRFLSVDPLTKQFPMFAPYQFAGNTPIEAIDLDGAEPFKAPTVAHAASILLKSWWSIRLTFSKIVGNSMGIKVNLSFPDQPGTHQSSISNLKQIWKKPEASQTQSQQEGSKLANFGKDMSENTSPAETTPHPSETNTSSGSGFLSTWPYIVPKINDEGLLHADRVGGLDANNNPIFYGGPYDGLPLNTDDHGNILNPNTGDILYKRPPSLRKDVDVILPEAEAVEKFGHQAEGKGARIYSGNPDTGASEKTNTIKQEIQDE